MSAALPLVAAARQLQPVIDSDSFGVEIGALLRRMRTRAAMTRPQLAKRTGIHVNLIERYENGTNAITAERLFLILNQIDRHEE